LDLARRARWLIEAQPRELTVHRHCYPGPKAPVETEAILDARTDPVKRLDHFAYIRTGDINLLSAACEISQK
jgi:hypothetical protein